MKKQYTNRVSRAKKEADRLFRQFARVAEQGMGGILMTKINHKRAKEGALLCIDEKIRLLEKFKIIHPISESGKIGYINKIKLTSSPINYDKWENLLEHLQNVKKEIQSL